MPSQHMRAVMETSNELKYRYHPEIPDALAELASAPSIQRLRHIGMNCGCEYTSFPVFQRPGSYHRYEHSLGVALIVWHFTHDLKQAVSGLLHDIATPVFAHVIDFLCGDYLQQEATEDGTSERIEADPQLMSGLKRFCLSLEDVNDYHRYPIADNDSPRLSADRLEYTIGNILHYGFGTQAAVDGIYQDLAVLQDENGVPELGFEHAEAAKAFSNLSLKCSRLYVSAEDRYAMQRLSELIREAVEQGVLNPDCLYSTEPEVIKKLNSEPVTRNAWNDYSAMSQVTITEHPEGCLNPRIVYAKKRYIDPLIQGKGRVSEYCSEYRDELQQYLEETQNVWISELR